MKGGSQFALPGTPGDAACLQKGSFLNVKSRFKEVGTERGGRNESRVLKEVCGLLKGVKELPLEDLEAKATISVQKQR